MPKLLLLITFLTFITADSLIAFDLLYQDETGDYHYRCDASSADVTIKIVRESVRINGGPRTGIYYIPKNFFSGYYPEDLRQVRKDLKQNLANFVAAYACQENGP